MTDMELCERRKKVLKDILDHPKIVGKKVRPCRHLKGRFDFISYEKMDSEFSSSLDTTELDKLNNFDFVSMGLGSQFGVCFDHFSTEYAVIISKSLMSGCYGTVALFRKDVDGRYKKILSKSIGTTSLFDDLDYDYYDKVVDRYDKTFNRELDVKSKS